MADAQDLGSCTERCRGSTPLSCIKGREMLPTVTRKLILFTLGCVVAASTAFADDVYVPSGRGSRRTRSQECPRPPGQRRRTLLHHQHPRVPPPHRRDQPSGTQRRDAVQRRRKGLLRSKCSKDEAAAKTKYSEAVTGYTATLGSTNKPWLKDYVAQRMQIAAPARGFDAALSAWKAMVEKDPVAASNPNRRSPGSIPSRSTSPTPPRTLLASANASPKPEVRKAYLELLGDVQTAMGDTEAAIKTAEMRVSLGGTPEEINDLAMKQAQNDFANKRYDQAEARLDKLNMASLSDASRAEATYMLAECHSSKLQTSASQDQWKDAAIDYMKVVAGFPTSPKPPRRSSRSPRSTKR